MNYKEKIHELREALAMLEANGLETAANVIRSTISEYERIMRINEKIREAAKK